MLEKIKAIDEEILSLKKEMELVEGMETEVYSRIVGYYRSVRNWNLGKRGEFKVRVPFSTITGRDIKEVNQTGEVSYESVEDVTDSSLNSYTYFFRTTCPNCPPMKEILKSMGVKAQSFNVDTDEGMEEASRLNIFSAPTVVFFDKKGNEIYRTGNPKDVETRFINSEATA